MTKIEKANAYKNGYCEHCSAFFNYRIIKTSKTEAQLKEKINSSSNPRFMCGLTLPEGKKHLCTVAFRYPEVIDRWKKEHRITPGKYIEFVEDVFK